MGHLRKDQQITSVGELLYLYFSFSGHVLWLSHDLTLSRNPVLENGTQCAHINMHVHG